MNGIAEKWKHSSQLTETTNEHPTRRQFTTSKYKYFTNDAIANYWPNGEKMWFSVQCQIKCTTESVCLLSLSFCVPHWMAKVQKKTYNSWSLFLSQSAAWLNSERGDRDRVRIKTTTNERSSSYQKHNLRQNSLQNVHTMENTKRK